MADGISSAFELNPLPEVDFHRAPATSSPVKRVMTLVVKQGEAMNGGVAGKLFGAVPTTETHAQPRSRLENHRI